MFATTEDLLKYIEEHPTCTVSRAAIAMSFGRSGINYPLVEEAILNGLIENNNQSLFVVKRG
jgi:hypothetical protein